MNITASQVKELRQQTGVGMMDCKKALVESNGDFKKAATLLREKGLAKAAKKVGRTAAEGLVEIQVSEDRKQAIILELNCETDFAAKNESFCSFAKQLATAALENGINNLEQLKQHDLGSNQTVDDKLKELIAVVGENIDLRRVSLVQQENGLIASYNHMGGRIGVLVSLEGENNSDTQSLGFDLAMHIAASAPKYYSRDKVSSQELEEEKELIKKKLENEGKPAHIAEKIMVGQISKFYAESCFLDQAFVKEPKMSVSQYIKKLSIKASPVDYVRFQLGEGVEIKKDNFAEEVAQLAK